MAAWMPEEDVPTRAPGGYRWYFVRVSGGFVLEFSSLAQLEHCRDILSQKLLPTTRALSQLVGPNMGPNQHWLSRLPARLKPWAVRQRLVKSLERALQEWRPDGAVSPGRGRSR